ncbi:MAG: hypothetical protein M3168_01770 [Actinomycetota bacterium]|nr:hypothetical protein [Actinomycetota bacterium]
MASRTVTPNGREIVVSEGGAKVRLEGRPRSLVIPLISQASARASGERMKPRLTLLLAATALVALALVDSAMAAYTTPRLSITNPAEKTSGSGRVTIRFAQAKEDDATFRFQIYVPLGYTTSLVPTAGQHVGTAAAIVNATGIAADALVPVTGRIVGDTYDATRYPAGAACVGDPAIQGVWRVELAAAGQTLIVPMYVQTITSGPLAAFASGRLTTCLASPYPEAGPARAALGAKLVSTTLNVRGVFGNPTSPGAYRWRALATPYTPHSAAPNSRGSVEIQALDTVPVALTAAARVDHRLNRVTLSGRLTEDAVGASRAVVQILRGGRVVKSEKTKAGGTFATALRLRPGRYTLKIRARRGNADLGSGACAQTFAPLPCIAATSSSFSVVATRSFRIR